MAEMAVRIWLMKNALNGRLQFSNCDILVDEEL